MNRDKARKLVGGYATGSLTDAERTALFAAALDDQELFDELAHEQSLKELLDEPGVRDRLIAALAPKVEQRRWSWSWAGAAAALAGCAALAIFWMNAPKSQNSELTAKVELPSPRTAPGPPVFDESAPAPLVAPVIAPAPAAPVAKNVGRPKAQEQEKRTEKSVGTVGALNSPAAFGTTAGAAVATEPPVLKAENGPAPPPPTPGPSSFAPQAARAKTAPAAAPAAPEQARVGAVPATVVPFSAADAARNGFAAGGGAVGGFVQQPTFGFRYQVNETFLQVIPTSIGWLTVMNGNAVLFSNRMVPNGVPLAIPLPADAKELTVEFSSNAGPVSSTAQHRTALNGVVAADSEVAIIIPARP